MGALEFFVRNRNLFEYILACFFVVYYLPHRTHFVLRLAISVPVAVGLYFALPYLGTYLSVITGNAAVMHVSRIIVIFSVVILLGAVIGICYKLTLGQTMFVAIFVLIIQSGFDRLQFLVLTVLSGFFGIGNIGDDWVAALVYFLLLILYYFAVYYLIMHKFKRITLRVNNLHTVVVLAIFVSVCVFGYLTVLLLINNGVIARDMIGYCYSAFISVLACPFIIWNLLDSVSKESMKHEILVVQALWKADRKQYEFAKKNIDIINIKYHDLKHRKYDKSEREHDTDDISFNYIRTGNEALDVVLTEKAVYCSHNGIIILPVADGGALDFMEASDVYSLFGNAVDNAAECLSDIDDQSKKIIEISVRRINGMAYVRVENYLPALPKFIDGLPVTTKPDKSNHGFGLKSMRMIAEKYRGSMAVDTDNDLFTLLFSFPL